MENKKKRKWRWGDRNDGRLVRSLPAMTKLTPYIMPQRNDALNSFHGSFDVRAVEKYVREKKEQGMKSLTMMHVILAAYVHVLSQRPALNRFIMGQKIYARNLIEVQITVKKEMKLSSPDTCVDMIFPPDATVETIYRIAEEEIQKSKNDDTSFDGLAKVIDYIPGLVKKFVIWFLRVLDYFGCLPLALKRLSPFHASLFITSMASLGLPPIYHHIYNFGNVPVFIAIGIPERKVHVNPKGEIEVRKEIGYKIVMDERICDGYYFASAFRLLNGYLRDPWQLDVPPTEIAEDVD